MSFNNHGGEAVVLINIVFIRIRFDLFLYPECEHIASQKTLLILPIFFSPLTLVSIQNENKNFTMAPPVVWEPFDLNPSVHQSSKSYYFHIASISPGASSPPRQNSALHRLLFFVFNFLTYQFSGRVCRAGRACGALGLLPPPKLSFWV